MQIQNIDISSVVLSGKYEDGLLKFVAPGTVLAGTILARSSATGQFIPFIKGDPGDAGVPKAIIDVDVTATAPGDSAIRALISGEVRTDKLVIDADGDSSNVDENVKDQLRSYSIIPIDVTENLILDNQ